MKKKQVWALVMQSIHVIDILRKADLPTWKLKDVLELTGFTIPL